MTALPHNLTAGSWNIDASHSEANFTVRHAGIAKVHGSVPISQGVLTVGADVENSSVSASLDPAGVSTRETKRDEHLKSGDFFDVANFPTWTFASTSLTADGDDFSLAGDLTIHGVTRPVSLSLSFNGTAVDPYGNTRAGFEASTKISRKDFGLTWNAALEAGGVLVGDAISIELDISAILSQ